MTSLSSHISNFFTFSTLVLVTLISSIFTVCFIFVVLFMIHQHFFSNIHNFIITKPSSSFRPSTSYLLYISNLLFSKKNHISTSLSSHMYYQVILKLSFVALSQLLTQLHHFLIFSSFLIKKNNSKQLIKSTSQFLLNLTLLPIYLRCRDFSNLLS